MNCFAAEMALRTESAIFSPGHSERVSRSQHVKGSCSLGVAMSVGNEGMAIDGK